ncbi:hypothetical protein D3C81_2295580 [compost metagenome]
MVISRSPRATNAPSRKWIPCMVPATRGLSATRSTDSNRPENASHSLMRLGIILLTETGTAASAMTGASAWLWWV